jgi:hypothetical protein
MESVAFVVCNALALLVAWQVACVLLPCDRGFARFVATLAAVPAVVIPTLTILGTVGLLTATAAGIALAVLAAGLLFARRTMPVPAEVSASGAQETRTSVAVAGAILGVLALQVVSFLHGQLLLGWRPQWDDLSYHATMAAHWLQAERMVLAPYHYHAYYPGNGELFAAWFMLPSKLDGYASLAGAYSMLLCGACVALLSRRLGCNAACTALSGATLMACKPFWQQAGSFAAVDLTGTATACAAVALAVPSSAEQGGTTSRGRAWLVGSLFGVAIGCKVTFAPLAIATFGYMLFELRPSARESARLLGLFSGAALLCGGFYYARNLWLTGNPLFPAAVLGFGGPLDAAARRPTSLLYQLRAISPEQRAQAWTSLLAWPSAVAYPLLAAYAVTFAASLHPRSWKQAKGRLLAMLLVVGLLACAVVASGPFSGTENAKFARLSIRLRFFLPTVVLAIPLAMYWVQWLGRGTPFLAAACAIGIAYLTGEPWPWPLTFALGGAVLAWAAFSHVPSLSRAAVRGFAVGCLVAGPCAAAWAMTYKQPANDTVMRTVIPAWNVLEAIPEGSHVAWFSSFEGYKYYRAFGRKLKFVPVPVASDGARIPFMHEYWRKYNPTWWVSLASPDQPTDLMTNLRARHVTHVLVIKRHTGPWPAQRDTLIRASGVHAIAKGQSLTLFAIEGR